MKNLTFLSVFLGTAIEVYDHSVFAFLIPVLSEVFFSSQSHATALSFTVLAYVVSFAVKPFSSLIFGYLTDIYGRKKVLLWTTFLMTLSTAIIGLLPTTLPVILLWAGVFGCRIIQGISLAGEFSTGVIMAVEQGEKRPAFSGSLAFMGGTFGLLLANLTVFILLQSMQHDHVVQYGWRIPFLVSTLIWLFLIYIRKNIRDHFRGKTIINNSYVSLFKTYKNELAITFVTASLSASAFYMTFIFMPTFLSSYLHVQTHQKSLLITLSCLLLYFISLPTFGALADKIGVEKQITLSTILYLMFSYMYFALITKFNDTGIFGVLIFFTLVQALLNSALPSFMVSKFPTVQRGKALAISYNTGLTLFGGLMPYLILTHGNSVNPGIIISVCALLTLYVLRFVR